MECQMSAPDALLMSLRIKARNQLATVTMKTWALMLTMMMAMMTTDPPSANQIVKNIDKRTSLQKEPLLMSAWKRSKDLFCAVTTGNALWMGSTSSLQEKTWWPNPMTQSKQTGVKLTSGLMSGLCSSGSKKVAIIETSLLCLLQGEEARAAPARAWARALI